MWHGLTGPALPVVIAGLGSAALSLLALSRRRYLLARAAGLLTGAVFLWGWFVIQDPRLIGPRLTIHTAAATHAALGAIAIASGVVLLIVLLAMFLLFAGIPQRGLVLGSAHAPVRMVEFADLQCPYSDEFDTQALPSLITHYVRPGKVSIEFRNLPFIGPDSVRAGLAAAAAEQQNKLWNFVDLMYLNQGEENTGYVTNSWLHRLFAAIPGLNVARAERASRTPQAAAVPAAANAAATTSGVDATPSFLVGRAGGPPRSFQPNSLTPGPSAHEFDSLLSGHG